jgi:UDP-galactopyranose mutase
MSKVKRVAKQMGLDSFVKKEKRNKGVSMDAINDVKKVMITKDDDEEVKVPADFESDTIKIYSWNVNGIRAVIGRKQLQTFIEKYSPDVLCINETKIDEAALAKQNVKVNIPSEYTQYWNCSQPPKKGYSGCAIFTKGKIISISMNILSNRLFLP